MQHLIILNEKFHNNLYKNILSDQAVNNTTHEVLRKKKFRCSGELAGKSTKNIVNAYL